MRLHSQDHFGASMQDDIRVRISSATTKEDIEVGRVIGDAGNDAIGPTMVVFGGIHGNEPSGVFALNKVFELIEKNGLELKGRLIGLAGNLKALEQQKRYLSSDLNRLWTEQNMLRIAQGNLNGTSNDPEIKEQLVLFEKIKELITNGNGPFFFIDLHTTSSESIPFITINDTLSNRKFALRFPAHVILGIEEFIDGPLKGLHSRAIVVVNETGEVVYSEQVPETVDEPNYKAALEALMDV